MPERTYRIRGQVVDRATQRGVKGLRIETWDKDTRYHDLLGEKTTDADGRFEVTFDESYFGDFAPDVAPDLFFRVYQGKTLVKSTEGTVMTNVAAGDTDVMIQVDLGTEAEAAADRVSSQQLLRGIGWVQQSDFKGTGSEAMASARTVGRAAADAVVARLAEGDLPVIRPGPVRTNQVVKQDVATATRNLSKQDVEVAAVKEYDPRADRQSARLLTRFPARLKPGDRVELYQKDGQVRYYSVVREEPADAKAGEQAAEADAAASEQLQAELKSVREEVAARDERIAALETELSDLRTSAADLAKLKKDLTSLKGQVTRLKKKPEG